MPEFHQEQYIYLAGLTHKSALITWGAFFFKIKGKSDDQRFKLVDDGDSLTGSVYSELGSEETAGPILLG